MKQIHYSIRLVGIIVVFIVCYIIPLTNKVFWWAQNFYKKLRISIYPIWLIGIPTIAIAFMAIPRLLMHQIIFNLDEIGEIYLMLGFLLFSFLEYRKIDRNEK